MKFFFFLDPPSLSVIPVSKTVNQTDVVPLTCTVFALPRPEITWTDNRGDIVINPLEGVISITENSLDANTYSSVLTFLSIVKANESNYTCTAVNNVTNAIGAIDRTSSSLIVQGTSVALQEEFYLAQRLIVCEL